MPMPDSPSAQVTQGEVLADLPGVSSSIVAKIVAPFHLASDPKLVEVFDLTGAPPEALKAAGIEPGIYALCYPQDIPAVPGVNGYTGSDAWKTDQELLDNGVVAVREDLNRLGRWLIPWRAAIPTPFLPPGSPPGGYLRSTTVADPAKRRIGKRYHLPWEALVPQGEDPAKVRFDRARYGCWLAYLAKRGELPVPSEVRVERLQAVQEARMQRVEADPNLVGEARKRRIEEIAVALERTEKARTVAASAEVALG
jgi:hypothetical protein